MAGTWPNDAALVRFRRALNEVYGDRVERVVLYGSRARVMRGLIPTTT